MTLPWTDFVIDRLDALASSKMQHAKHLVALYELYSEYESGGLTQYLMNSSGDSFAAVREVVSEKGGAALAEWVSQVDMAFRQGRVPSLRDQRIDEIEAMPGFDDGVDPFDEQHKALRGLIPQLEAMASELTAVVAASQIS